MIKDKMRQLFFEELDSEEMPGWVDYRIHWAGSKEKGFGWIVSEDRKVVERLGETEHRRWFDCELGYDLSLKQRTN
jgi:hypothetical protein